METEILEEIRVELSDVTDQRWEELTDLYENICNHIEDYELNDLIWM